MDDLALARAWLAVQGISSPPETTLHPEDDMARGDVHGMEPERARFEYLRSGFEAREVLRHVLEQLGRPLESLPCLLDFACGYGRLLRWLVQGGDPARIHAADILRPALPFVRESFGVTSFPSAAEPEDLVLPHKYPVIWVGSLFTHLNRDRFQRFLRVLFQSLEPTGVLLFSTHGAELIDAEKRDPSGFTFVPESESHVLDREAYGTTWVDKALVREIATESGIPHLRGLPYALWRIQDLWAASPAPLDRLDEWTQAPLLRGSIAQLEVRGKEGALHAWIGGWIRSPRECGPIETVTLFIETEAGRHRIPTVVRPLAEELPEREGGERFLQSNWYIEGPTNEIGPGTHPLVAVARTAGGIETAFDARRLVIPD